VPFRLSCLILLMLATLCPPAGAQDYPSRPIRWVVPFPAGGPTDTLSRILAARLGEVWKAGIVIDNKGGAAGAIGTDIAAKAAPDGYTIQLGTQSTNGSNKIFYPNLPYDPIRDFEPLTLLGTACMALVIPNSIPASTPKELVEWIRKQEGVSYAAATGSSQHIAAELLVKRAGLKALSRQCAGTARPDGRPPRFHVRQPALGPAAGARRPGQGAGADLRDALALGTGSADNDRGGLR